MQCRSGCGACCIAPSISSYIPGMPQGKPAGVRCVNLLDDLSCRLWNSPERPLVCAQFRPEQAICGVTAQQAYDNLIGLEQAS